MHQTTTTAQEDFPTPADTQAWCELQLAGSPQRTEDVAPPDASTRTDWNHDTTNDAYTLSSVDIRCRVWRMLGSWNAILSHRGDATAGYNFKTVEDACTWCEAQIAERKVDR